MSHATDTRTCRHIPGQRDPEADEHAPLDQLADENGPTDDATAWRERGLCAQTDPEAFFPDKGGSTREAKRICAGCEVRAECLEWALTNDERFGIWGGLSERERRPLRRDRKERR